MTDASAPRRPAAPATPAALLPRPLPGTPSPAFWPSSRPIPSRIPDRHVPTRTTRPAVRLTSAVAAALCGLAALGGCAVKPSAPTAAVSSAAALASAPAGSGASAPLAHSAAASDAAAVAYAPVPTVAIDPLEPDVPVDPDSRAAQTDLWARVRSGFGMPDLDSDLVREEEGWYAARPDYVQRMTDRGARYLYHIVEEVERRGMPTELALLPFIESAFNPQAMSTAKASGMWQFVPATGRDYLLRQNVFRDDRRDVLASTHAALDHLARLYDLFGDWRLSLAAYNWGEGNVQRAIARNQKLGLPTDYESLRMPRETAHYLPKLQAVKNIVLHPDAYALILPALTNHAYFLSVPIHRDIDVDLAARYAGVGLDEFKTLNPQLNKPVILAAGTPQVLLPYDNATEFARRLSAHTGPMASWTAWTAPRTLRPAEAARLVGMPEDQLREVNHIPARMLVKAGSTLLVPRGQHRADDVPSALADNATMSLAPDVPPLKRLALRAGHKDNVASVARRYGVSPLQVAAWNRVGTGSAFRAGQTVIVFVAAPTRGRHALPALAKAAPPAPGPAKGAAPAVRLAKSGARHAKGARVAKAPVANRIRVAANGDRKL